MKTAFGKIWMIVMGAIFALTFTACDSNDEKRTEIAKIVESRSCRELLNDLYIGSDGDVETLARMLGVTPSSIERIRRGSTRPTEQFEVTAILSITTYIYTEGKIDAEAVNGIKDTVDKIGSATEALDKVEE